MDNLELYMQDLKRVEAMNFDTLYLSHTHSLSPEDIVVDAKTKIRNYITYREEREDLIMSFVQKHKVLTCGSLFDLIYSNEDLSDPLRKKLAMTSFKAHLRKIINENKV